MASLRVDVFGFLFLLIFGLINACSYNDCICVDEMVGCELTDESEPLFSREELLEIRHLQVTATQTAWIITQCPNFPRLQRVKLIDGSKCSGRLCVECV
jgi:hypothetical protein